MAILTDYLTAIKCYSAAPVDPSLSDVCMPPSRGAWEAALASYQVAEAEECSYQRDTGVIRFPAAYPALSRINYVAFDNNAHQGTFGSIYRWFAFVERVQYINDNMTEIHVKVDPFHTYQTEISAGSNYAYVERMHSDTDEPGDNLLDDGIACGDYVTPYYDMLAMSDMAVIIASTKLLPDASENAPGTAINGILSGFKLYSYTPSEAAALIKQLADTGKSSAIQFMYMCPKAIIAAIGHEVIPFPSPVTYTPAGIPRTTVDGYEPRNKKLLTYPYVGYTLTTASGGQTYRGELFSGAISFRGLSTCAPGGGVELYPSGYGSEAGRQLGVKFTDFPACSWQSENFNTWLATQGLRQEAAAGRDAVQTIFNAGMSLVGGNPVGAVSSFLGYAMSAQSMATEREVASLQAPKLSGSTASIMTDIVNGKVGFEFAQRTVRRDIAETIDAFYDLYGYPCRRVLKVTMSASPRKWRYIKTSGYRLVAKMPEPYRSQVEAAFNSGVRFWGAAEDFLDYSLDNSP